jgi:hypothetical protein
MISETADITQATSIVANQYAKFASPYHNFQIPALSLNSLYPVWSNVNPQGA